jgi:hypothetical protein
MENNGLAGRASMPGPAGPCRALMDWVFSLVMKSGHKQNLIKPSVLKTSTT